MYLKIKEIVDSVSNTHSFDREELIFLNTSDVYEGKIMNYNLFPIEQLKGQAKKAIINGDILFSEIRPKNKHYAKVNVENPDNFVVSTKLMVLRNKNSIVNTDYFYYNLINDKMLDTLQKRAENRICSFPQITFDLLGEYEIYIPNYKTQLRITNT